MSTISSSSGSSIVAVMSNELCLPAVQLTPHIQLVKVCGPVGKQDDLTLSAELRGHAHAQSEGIHVEGLLGDHLHITGRRLRGEHHGLNGHPP